MQTGFDINNMNQTDQNDIDLMNNLNQINNMNPMNDINQINNMNPMNDMNNLNQINNMNPMYDINPMNDINNINNTNPMNNMNPMNDMNQMNNNFSLNFDSSYVSSSLHSLAFLNCIKDWYNQFNLNLVMNNSFSSLTKDFIIFLQNLYSGQKTDSSSILQTANNKSLSLSKKEIQKNPYRFLHRFLEILHIENNNPFDPNFNVNLVYNPSLESMQNHDYMYNLFSTFIQKTLNSIISQCFYNIEKFTHKCQNCPNLYFFRYTPIFQFDVEQFRIYRDQSNIERFGKNLNLDECFQCYSRICQAKCALCGNENGTYEISILSYTKILIIYFKRNNHSYLGDIDFNNNLNLYNNNYCLKACISYCSLPKYFCDVNMNNVWYRYIDDKMIPLNDFNKDIKEYEPQILVYELESNNQNQNLGQEQNEMFNPMNDIQSNDNFMFPQQNQSLFQQQQPQPQQQSLNHPEIKFLIVPKDWDGKDDLTIKIVPQLTLEDTIKKAIDNFFTKLQKPREAIKEFKFNDSIIDVNSNQKLSEFNFSSNSDIIAVKADNFDELN